MLQSLQIVNKKEYLLHEGPMNHGAVQERILAEYGVDKPLDYVWVYR